MRYISALLLILCTACASSDEGGPLVVVGGGGTPESVIAETAALAGGSDAVVVVIPHASRREDRGLSTAEMFRKAGALDVHVIEDLAAPKTSDLLARATLVWMPGGSQNRLLDALRETGRIETFRSMHANGVVFGGTSAGAAVQSELMITGEAKLNAIEAGATELVEGIGFWTDAIVDQHAVKRRRFNRLLSAVLDHPSRIGVAIDEKTAVIVSGRSFRVSGRSVVVIIDARNAEVRAPVIGTNHTARGITLHVLTDGMTFSW